MKIKITCRPRFNPWLKKYLNTKTFSKMLALGILINNIPINSFAGVLSDDGRYETFGGSDITVNDVLEEDKVDVEIEGNTLVNLFNGFSWLPDTENVYSTYIDNTLTFQAKEGFTQSIDHSYIGRPILSKNFVGGKTYTMYFKCNIEGAEFGFRGKIDAGIPTGSEYKMVTKQGTNKFVFTLDDDISLVKFFDLRLFKSNTNKPYIFEDFVILEGEVNYDYIPYFEGIKSVGQDDENGHKVEVSAVKGKPNLLKNSGFLEGTRHFVLHNGAIGEIVNDDTALSKKALKITADKLNSGTYVFNPIGNIENKRYIVTGYCKGEAGKSIYVNMEGHKRTVIDFIDNNWVKFSVISELNPVNWNKNITFYNLSNEGQVFYLKDLKLEISETPTPYIPHYTESNYNSFVNRKEILLNEPLRALPNGIKDRIIKRNGQWVIERNVEKVIFDGSDDENWVNFNTHNYSNVNNVTIVQKHNFIVRTQCNESKAISNYNIGEPQYSQNDILHFYTEPNIFEFFIDKSVASSMSEFKMLLKQNPLIFIYQLAEPIYQSLKIEPTFNLYTDVTYISNNSVIPANLKVTVDRVANRAKEYSELAKENPTIENISLARMWTNLMRESILKDVFQDNVDNITEIADMTLERKIASSNLDVYIKSENMLSMNLSTNSITFEDFSGVEDMVKENAVNISINSSLPYNLNVYLATDIQNSDKSNTMNKDILSIKDNSELDYQTFSNTVDKIVLKSNCSSGNDKQHDIDLKLNGGIAHEKDVYKTTIKFEAQQQ